jgi:hypothetical protein
MLLTKVVDGPKIGVVRLRLSLFVLLTVFLAQPVFAQRTVTFTRETPVYLLPDASREPLLVASKDSTADLVSIEGAWVRISFDDSRDQRRVGYVQSKFVMVVSEVPKKPDTQATPRTVSSAPALAKPNYSRPATPPRTEREAPTKKGAPILSVSIVDRKTSDSSYRYVAPATITSISRLDSNCSGYATNFTPYSTNVNVNCSGSARSEAVVNPSREYGYSVTGATFALKLPDGRHVIVNCESKYALKGDHINRRSCRIPMIDEIRVEFNADKAKLMWPTSIDGRKIESETYKILAIFDSVIAVR